MVDWTEIDAEEDRELRANPMAHAREVIGNLHFVEDYKNPEEIARMGRYFGSELEKIAEKLGIALDELLARFNQTDEFIKDGEMAKQKILESYGKGILYEMYKWREVGDVPAKAKQLASWASKLELTFKEVEFASALRGRESAQKKIANALAKLGYHR